ncbi:PA2169 family four-helix-bundle protein [Hymenobacter sp. BT730]|uniref:ferritin-like domain-containing protein n=1 Tax=Hymenobacter sp. BT730 TaxID=3063332 RepID=UPI0026DEB402|nr:PA2169 family four-helix-bundle protein [Hymenobacter sp. BT730]
MDYANQSNWESRKAGRTSSSRYASYSPEYDEHDIYSSRKGSALFGKGTVGGMIGSMSTTQKILGGALLLLGVSSLLKSGSSGGSLVRSQTDALQELLLFVNDRIEGYQRAVKESKDPELTSYYSQLVNQSQQFANKLNSYLRQQGIRPETSTTMKGKLYRGWMDAKAAVTGFDENAILGSNIYGEEWALKAYREALQAPGLSGEIRQEIERQYSQSQDTYQRLKSMEYLPHSAGNL